MKKPLMMPALFMLFVVGGMISGGMASSGTAAGGTASAGKDHVTLKPERPKAGERVVVAYDAGSEKAVLGKSGAILLEAIILRDGDEPLVREIPLTPSDGLWKGEIALDVKKPLFCVFRFRDRDRVDDREEACWDFPIHGRNGKPVEGALLQRAISHQRASFHGFARASSGRAVRENLGEELRLYPHNARARSLRWTLLRKEKGEEGAAEIIRSELGREYTLNASSEEAVAELLPWFERTGQAERGEAIRKDVVKRTPRGPIARKSRITEMEAEKDHLRRAALIRKFLRDFSPQGAERERLEQDLVARFVRAEAWDSAATALEGFRSPSSSSYNMAAWELAQRDADVERAILLAKKGVERARKEEKPASSTTADWAATRKRSLGAVLDTYAYALLKAGRSEEAEQACEEAYALLEGDDPELNNRLAECLLRNGKAERALQVAVESVRRSRSDSAIVGHLEAAYRKKYGDTQGLEDLLENTRAEARAEAREKVLRSRISRAAPDFALVSLDGDTVRLSSLRGKVVVVDFWATWCRPCISSFPTLQKVHRAMKENPDVMILAVNTWERNSGKERDAGVRKFIRTNGYTFPVLLDVESVEEYRVEGIPTKFVIGRDGRIQFKSVGFYSPEEMEQELGFQIETLLAETPGGR
ncbi:MAG: TlpA disulfide reductase family protein [Bacteroidota bacterium]